MALFPTRIVVGVADSEGARQALHAAIQLATATSSELHLVHVKLDNPSCAADRPHPSGSNG